MSERLLHAMHQALKKKPFLKWIDGCAISLWFHLVIPAVQRGFQVGLLLKLTALAFRKRRRLIVLCRFGGIGDIICSFPAVREFIRQNADSTIVYVTRTPYRKLVERSRPPIPCVTMARHVPPPRWATWIVKKCIHLSYREESNEGEVATGNLIAEFGGSLGLSDLAEEPVLEINPIQVKKIRSRYLTGEKKHLILLHTGPTWKVREWPLALWSRLVARLQENSGLQILQIVADRNVTVKDARCEVIPGVLPVPCADDVEKLIDTIAAADLLIGIDSGPIHVAGAVGTNCVALFGPTDPALRLWKSGQAEGVVHKLDCSFCHHRRPRLHWQTGCPYDIACMQGITVEQVLQKALDFLPHEARERRSS